MSAKDVKLGEIVDIVMGQAPPGEACNKDGIGTVFVKAGEFQERQPLVREWTTKPLKFSEPGDVLVCVVGATAGKINESVFRCAIGRSVAAVRADATRLAPSFLFHFLKTKVMQLRDGSQGAAQGVITREMLQSLSLKLPTLNNQYRIAAILDQADALRAKRREALAQLDSLTQSIFIEMFGDPVANLKNWPKKTLKELGRVKTGGTPPSSKEGMFDGLVPFVTPGDLGHNQPAKRTVTELGASEAETVRAGAALVCCIGATIGKMAKASEFCAFNQQINAVEWSAAIDDDFGIHALGFFKTHIATQGASTTLPILKKSSFEKISIPIPPFTMQKVFADRIGAIANLKENLRSSLSEMDDLFSSLQHRAFSGAL